MNNSITYTLKVYLKGQKKPIIFDVDTEKSLNDFYTEIQTHDIVSYGPVIFSRDSFLYAYIEIN